MPSVPGMTASGLTAQPPGRSRLARDRARRPAGGRSPASAPAMSGGNRQPRLRGHSECDALDGLVASVRAGRVLFVRGEARAGKTALFDDMLEMELAFAGLHQLCPPFLDRLERLAGSQGDALATAIGLRTGTSPDRFLVGLAVLGLLAEAAEQEPLVCLIDDAHWLDRVSAQTLAFVPRRLLAERIALMFAVREPSEEHGLAGLRELLVPSLSDGDARAAGLRDHRAGGERVRDRIGDESRGNPLAPLELPGASTVAELAGGFGLPDPHPPAGRIEQSYVRRLRPLPAETPQLVLAAAAKPLGDPALLRRAADRLEIGLDAATAAEAAGLIRSGARTKDGLKSRWPPSISSGTVSIDAHTTTITCVVR
jgi:hypothetical protein